MRSRDRVCLGISGTALAVSTLLMGGVFRWTQAIVAILVAGALLSQVSSRRRLDRLSPIVLLLGLAIALTVIQLIPLPQAVIAALNRHGHDLRMDGAALSHTSPWPCLSMDPAGTLRGLAFLITLLGVALVSLRFAASERGRFVLIGGVAIACGLVAAVTGLHAIVNANTLYGIYEATHAPPVVGPLLNPNHLGCLMAFGATLAFGLAFFERQTAQWRALWVVISAGCASVALLSLSRGAAISLVLGVVVTSSLLIGRRLGDVGGDSRRRRRFSSNQLPIVLVITVGFGLAVFSSAGKVADQLGKTSMVELEHPASKFAAWKASTRLIVESPWVGVGRGAVEPTFTRVYEPSAYVTFSHLENEYIQAVVEWGVPGGILLALALGWCIVTALRRWRDGPLVAGAIGGIAGVMFQSSVDFGVELLGVAIPVTIVASTLQLVPLCETSRFGWLRLGRIVLVVVLAGAAVMLSLPTTRTLEEDHAMLVATRTPHVQDLVEVIERHPLDYFAFGQAGEELMYSSDPRAVAFLNHALTLHPSHPGLHRLTARLLVSIGRTDQAAVEYSLAMTGATRPHLLLAEIVAMLPATNDAAAAIPLDYPKPDTVLKSLAQLNRLDISERWLMRIVDQPTHDLRLIDELYKLGMDRNDLEVALRAARARFAESQTPTSRLMLARVEFQRNELDAVLEQLSDVKTWRGRLDERADAWLLVCDAHHKRRNWDAALECLHHLDATGSMNMRRNEIVTREGEISDERTSELRIKQIQNLERSLNLPIDTDIPVIRNKPEAPAPQPGIGIENPIRNPLKPFK